MHDIPVKLLLMLDSRSPAGAHNHSGGMEPAVAQGWVADADDVERFCLGRLLTAGRVAAAFAATAHRLCTDGASPDAWLDLDSAFTARTPSPATRQASRVMGSGLRRLLLATVPDQAVRIRQNWALCPRPAPHQVLVLGAATALTGGSARVAARAAATATCAAPASAALRLLGLDPYAMHAVSARLAEEIETVADAAAAVTDVADLPADSAPALELLADVHAISEVRLFAS